MAILFILLCSSALILTVNSQCYDTNRNCYFWSTRGECNRNPRYMLAYCKRSCNQCKPVPRAGTIAVMAHQNCRDMNGYCSGWAKNGECKRNPRYMMTICKKSCGKCKVDGKYGPWQAYSRCSKSCGGGIKTRKRLCNNPRPANGGKHCSGPSSQSITCNTHKCPVHGKFGSWQAYSGCSKSCGGGFKTRKRLCNNPRPAHGGKICSGPSIETTACNTHKCPVDGKFGPWQAYSSQCSSYCGGGVRIRQRLCNNPKPAHGGKSCSGPSIQTIACNTHKCPVNGKFGPWQPYSKCTRSCGGGFKLIGRYCNNPKPADGGKVCSGHTTKTTSCNTHKCPVTVLKPSTTSINDMYCGLKTANLPVVAGFRVAGGTDARKGEWPWLVGIARKHTPWIPKCGGSLINEQWVLTAAHCFRNVDTRRNIMGKPRKAREFVARLNEHNLRENDGTEIVTDIEKLILHPDFNPKHDNDIALLKLAKPVKYNTTSAIRSICLPTPNKETVPGDVCHVAGWGVTAKTLIQALILQEAVIKILPKSKCKPYLGFKITPNMFCAGSVSEINPQDTCKGDSGGPLACVYDNKRFELTGIVSWGPQPCGKKDEHGFYSKVSNYIDWIKTNIQS